MKVTQWYVGVAALFVTCLIAANVVAVKLVALGPLVVPAGVVVFPVGYILGDVLTEVYGFRRARTVIWLGFGCNLLFVAAA
ncbi:MAG TPA: VUT family protein, partial [Thermomicrobiales bacterium]|nr:VUT family protein [Thermomicrobiales bacterium]